MEDNKEKLKEEQLEDVNGGVIIITGTGDADKAGDGFLPFGGTDESPQGIPSREKLM